MPTYSFRNIETDEITDVFMRMSAREDYLKEHPELEQTITAAAPLGDPMTLGRVQAPDDFKYLLRKIKKENKHSTIQSW